MDGSDSYRTLLLLCLHQQTPATTATITPMTNRGTRMPAAIAPPGTVLPPAGAGVTVEEGEGDRVDDVKVGVEEGKDGEEKDGEGKAVSVENVGSMPDEKALEEMKGCGLDELRTGPKLDSLGDGPKSELETILDGEKTGSNEVLLLTDASTHTATARNSSIIFMIVPLQSDSSLGMTVIVPGNHLLTTTTRKGL